MPSLVRYAHEILSEDRYGYLQVERVSDRISSMNDSQLAGMVSHLSGTASRARSGLWRDANRAVLGHVAGEFEERERAIREEEARLWELDKEEREAREMSALRMAESAAAEKQIAKTAARVAKEETETYLQTYRTEAKIQHMHDSNRARTIRSYAWWTAGSVMVGQIVVLKVIDSNRTNQTSIDLNMLAIGFVCSLIVVLALAVGWRFGYAKLKVLSPKEVEDLVEAKMGELLVQFHEADTRRRNLIEINEAREAQEKRERIAARKKEKRRLDRLETIRKTAAADKEKEMLASRRKLFERRPSSLKDMGDIDMAIENLKEGQEEPKGIAEAFAGSKKKKGVGFAGLMSQAANAAADAVEKQIPGKQGGEVDLEMGLGGDRPETDHFLGDTVIAIDGGDDDDDLDEVEVDEDDVDDPELDPVLRRKTVDKKKAIGNMGLVQIKRGAVLPVSPADLHVPIVHARDTLLRETPIEELLEESQHMYNRPETPATPEVLAAIPNSAAGAGASGERAE